MNEMIFVERSKPDGSMRPVGRSKELQSTGLSATSLKLDYTHDIASLRDEWLELQINGSAGIYQNYEWVKIALETLEAKNQVFIVTARSEQGLEIILPMVLETGLIRKLRWIGGSHANICSGIFSQRFLKQADETLVKAIIKKIGKLVGGLAIAYFGNQVHQINGMRNPFSYTLRQKSVNSMFVMDLNDGFEALLEAGNAKRKRRAFRKQIKISQEAGGYELIAVNNDHDAITAIEEFMEFKRKRFAELGIRNVFIADGAKEFMERLATNSDLVEGKLFQIFQLKIAGETRAIYAGSHIGNRYQAFINAISIDELSQISPGEMLLYLMTEYLCTQGVTYLDLGVGLERYKRSWCQHEYELFDSIIPLSVFATPISALARAKTGIKEQLRSNETFWNFYKKLRKGKQVFKKS